MADQHRSSRHAGIDREAVIECALALVESGGAEALTMRKLAAELGVTATSIYWHVGSRDDVIIAVIERQAAELGQRAVVGETPRDRLIDVARQVWDSALEHPEVMKLAYGVGATSLLDMQLEIAMARELADAGIVGTDARDALRAILLCVGGFLVLALRPATAVPPELASTTLWAQVDDAMIDPTTRQALTEVADLQALFDRTIAAVIDGWL